MKFDQYPISDEIKRNLAQLGFKRPTDIQYKAIPSILQGEDVLAIAQTGTGKTAAFAIPIIDRIHDRKSSRRFGGIKCLVMVPTRELAMQIGEVFSSIARHTRTKVFALYGGVEQDPQIKKLQEGLDVLITTPGRMFDLISQGYIDLKTVDTLVLDEADHMLDLGFIEDIKYVKKMLTQKHQTLFFSATIDPKIKKLAFSQVRNSAVRIQISPDDPVSKNVSHYVMFVEMDDKRFFLERFINDNPGSKTIVFVRTRVRAERVCKAMERVGITTCTIHGEKEQEERARVMDDFKAGKRQIMIATDVSARGIDIPEVDFVINYDLPEDPEFYVHRVGRTGRGTSKGTAISFCSSEEKEILGEIQSLLKKEISELQLSKGDYLEIAPPPRKAKDIKALLKEHEEWENKKKIKKARKQEMKKKRK